MSHFKVFILISTVFGNFVTLAHPSTQEYITDIINDYTSVHHPSNKEGDSLDDIYYQKIPLNSEHEDIYGTEVNQNNFDFNEIKNVLSKNDGTPQKFELRAFKKNIPENDKIQLIKEILESDDIDDIQEDRFHSSNSDVPSFFNSNNLMKLLGKSTKRFSLPLKHIESTKYDGYLKSQQENQPPSTKSSNLSKNRGQRKNPTKDTNEIELQNWILKPKYPELLLKYLNQNFKYDQFSKDEDSKNSWDGINSNILNKNSEYYQHLKQYLERSSQDRLFDNVGSIDHSVHFPEANQDKGRKKRETADDCRVHFRIC